MTTTLTVSDQTGALDPATDARAFLAPHVTSYLEELTASTRTRQAYTHALARFLRFVEGKPFAALKRPLIVQYREELLQRLAARSASLYLAVVRNLFTWLEGHTQFPNIAAGVKGARAPQEHARDTLSQDQGRALLAHLEANAGSVRGKRDLAIVTLLLHTGVRAVEAVRANVRDVSKREGKDVLYVQGKGHADRGLSDRQGRQEASATRSQDSEARPPGDVSPLPPSVHDRHQVMRRREAKGGTPNTRTA